MLKRIYLLIVVLFTCFSSCFASYEDRLFELEILRYGKTFQHESLSERLLRLEEDFFGLSQSGDINSRINMLNKIAQNNYPNPMNIDRQINTKKQNRIISAFKDFASALTDTGVVTGFIPPVTNYNNSFYDHYDPFYNHYDPFYNQKKHSCNYSYPYGFDSRYSNSNVQYDRYGYPSLSNRDLYSRSAVTILRD